MRVRQALLLLVVAGGCASAPVTGEFRRSMGNASAPDMVERARKVLALHSYEVDREENTPQSVLVQSRWLRRQPFVDERTLGVTDAENRVTVSGRFRLQTEQGPLYAIDLLVERRVVMMGKEGWIDSPSTPEYLAYADSLHSDLKRELDVGTRRFDR